ncbi:MULTISPECIES: hypothetical protein [Rhizobium/Agrobacterium group]|uniref:hypothetical protein n=1 Tax=Rhizobium/Agrobacterium group TaxID=227290 RepID=UPI001E41439C|nr:MULTISPECIES: hypothetical protein [Rhizobium/Agrobacterium group]
MLFFSDLLFCTRRCGVKDVAATSNLLPPPEMALANRFLRSPPPAVAMRSWTTRVYGAGSLRQKRRRRSTTQRKIKDIDSGSPQYWRERAEGFRLIREAEHAYDRLKRAPTYISGGYDEDGDVIPLENLGPCDAMDEAIKAIEANETAVDILVAQRRTEIGGWRIYAVIRELNPAAD